MDHFLYRDGALFAEDVAISEIAAAVGTPFYVYSTATLLRHFKAFDDALDGMDHGVLCNESQFKPGGSQDAGAGGRGHGCGVCRRIFTRQGRGRTG